MTVTISDGWLSGSLPDDHGREWPIKRFPQPSARGPMAAGKPNLVLHTTETFGYVESLKYPSNFQCGDGIIGQHIRLGLAGDSLNTWDLRAMQIEMVSFSHLARWLPQESTLGPTVALTAWLHRTGRIKTGVKRPTEKWPLVLDRGPQASLSYYRRFADLWPDVPGVYGHVDIPANKHWDPGSFDYPVFFDRVQKVLGLDGGDMAILTPEEEKQLRNFLDELSEQLGTATARGTARRIATAVVSTEKDVPAPDDGITVAEADERYAPKAHPHTAKTDVV